MKICFRCGKIFEKKSRFFKHLQRIKKCKANLLDVSYEEIENSYDDLLEILKLMKEDKKMLADVSRNVSRFFENFSKKVKKDEKKAKKVKKIVNFKSKNGKKSEKKCKKVPKMGKKNPSRFDSSQNGFDSDTKKSSKLECQYCHKIFKHRSSFSRHVNKRCKMRNIIVEEKAKIDITADILKKLEDLKAGPTINYYTNNYTQHIINNTQNIIINNYGKEDISYITNECFKKILQGPFASIQRTNNMIHFNKEHPENMNVKITNKKDPFVKIYKKDKWCLADKSKVIKEMIEKAMNLIDEYYEKEGKIDLETSQDTNYQKFLMAYNSSPDFKRRLHEDIELMIINGGLVIP